MKAYTPEYKIWVPRRASTKSTFPGMLDNSVAGGISAGDTPLESMIRECYEEAGFHESLVRSTIKVGNNSFLSELPQALRLITLCLPNDLSH